MPTPREIETRFWRALASDRTMMLRLDGVEDGHARPMTALAENGRAPIWFFTARASAIVRNLFRSDHAVATFASKRHRVFAALHGRLGIETDGAVIDDLWSLWNLWNAAWFEGGRGNPKLVLLRLDPRSAEIWLDEAGPFAGVGAMLGLDRRHERGGVVKVTLGRA